MPRLVHSAVSKRPKDSRQTADILLDKLSFLLYLLQILYSAEILNYTKLQIYGTSRY